MVLGLDGQPDLHATVLANFPGRPPGQWGSRRDRRGRGPLLVGHGAADGASIAGLSDEQVAQDVIQQAGSKGTLGFGDLLEAFGVGTTTANGKDMAQSLKFAWDRVAHGQAGPSSASQVAGAVRAYRKAEGDDITAGGAMWRG